MADFKKLDDDTVAADEPLDSYVLHRVEENLSAIRAKRPRRFAWGWPQDDVKDRPILACHQNIAYLLGRWPVTVGVRQLKVRIRYKVYKTSINIGVGIVSASGIEIGDLTSKAAGTHDDEFLVDVDQYEGDLADLVMVIRSDSINPVTESYTNHRCVDDYYTVDADSGAGTSFPWTSGDRWMLEFINPSSGSDSQDGDTMPDPQTIAWINGTDDNNLYCYPGYEISTRGLNGWQGGSYQIRVSELGYVEMYGVSVEEVQAEWSSISNQVLTGNSPTAQACGHMYQRGRRFFVEQTRVHHFGPTADNGMKAPFLVTQPVLLWGEMREYSTDWQPLVSCLVGRYDQSSLSGTTRERSETNISGFLQGIARDPHTLRFKVRARLISFNVANALLGQVWDPDMGGADAAVYSDEIDIHVSARAVNANRRDAQGLLLGMSNVTGVPSYHFLRGAMDYAELNGSTSAGLTPFSLQIKETAASTTARLLEIQIKGASTETAEGVPIVLSGFSNGVQTGVACPSWTAWTNEVSGGI